MKRVAVFGDAGGSKSTLARQLAKAAGLPLYPIDIIKFRAGTYRPDSAITQEAYRKLHADLLIISFSFQKGSPPALPGGYKSFSTGGGVRASVRLMP